MKSLNTNLIEQLQSGELKEFHLLRMLLNDTPTYGNFTDCDVPIFMDDVLYNPRGFKFDPIAYGGSQIVQNAKIGIDNIDQYFDTFFIGGDPRGNEVILKKILMDSSWHILGNRSGLVMGCDLDHYIPTNLITNGDMEVDDNWADFGGPTTNEQSSEQQYSGQYSRKIVASAATQGAQSDTYTTTTGYMYMVSCWIYCTTHDKIRLTIRQGDGVANVALPTVTLENYVSGEWCRATFIYEEPSGGSSAYIAIKADEAQTFYIDHVEVGRYYLNDVSDDTNYPIMYNLVDADRDEESVNGETLKTLYFNEGTASGDQYGEAGDDDTLDDIRTFALWVNPVAEMSHGTSFHLLLSKDSAYYHGLLIDYGSSPNRFRFQIIDSNSNTYFVNYSIPSYDTWYYIVGRINADLTGELIVNNDSKGTTTALDDNENTNMLAAPVRIGGGVANRYSAVKVADVRCYNRPLTNAEIEYLYNNPGADLYTGSVIMFQGELDGWEDDEEELSIIVTSENSRWTRKSNVVYSANCRWKTFKGTECGYAGSETWCDRSYARCSDLSNISNFGGFRWLPSIINKEVHWGLIPT